MQPLQRLRDPSFGPKWVAVPALVLGAWLLQAQAPEAIMLLKGQAKVNLRVLEIANGKATITARVGEQTGLQLRARVNRVPSWASRSICGVLTTGLP